MFARPETATCIQKTKLQKLKVTIHDRGSSSTRRARRLRCGNAFGAKAASSGASLPAAGLQKLRLFNGGSSEALHRPRDLLADFGENLGVVPVRSCDDDGLGARDGFFALLGEFSTSSGVARSFMKIPEPTKMASAPVHHERRPDPLSPTSRICAARCRGVGGVHNPPDFRPGAGAVIF